jgi:threonine synthase
LKVDVAPSVRLKEFWVLELFHGPTFAFKDIALQFLGNLFEYFLKRGRKQKRLTILGATSGDTGSAAIHGLRGKKNINCFILFPHGKVTEIQERQMTTVPDPNVHCISIRGDFDDAQALVKDAFHDQEFRDSVQLGAVNSINWARVLAQITYYFYSWFRVTDGLRSHGQSNLKVNYAVPTGNFGDILAGYYAKRMGLPIDKLVIATNSNDVLHRFMLTGEYRRQRTRATLAPSMDISVSSNFERYLYYLANEDRNLLTTWMDEFENKGTVTLPESCMQIARSEFLSWAAGKIEILGTMRSVYQKHHYLVCPHTATAIAAVRRLQMDPARTVVLATAHPAKFEDALLLAVSNQVLPPRPEILMELFDLPVRRTLLPPALDDIELFIKRKVFDQKNEQEDAKKQEAARIAQRKHSRSQMLWWTTISVVVAMAAGATFYWFRKKKLIR